MSSMSTVGHPDYVGINRKRTQNCLLCSTRLLTFLYVRNQLNTRYTTCISQKDMVKEERKQRGWSINDEDAQNKKKWREGVSL